MLRSTNAAFWMYDYLQTLPMEIHTIWFKRFTGISLMFYINRYLLLVSVIAEIYTSTPGYASSARFRGLLSAPQTVIVILKMS